MEKTEAGFLTKLPQNITDEIHWIITASIIDKNYRTISEDRTIVGHSFGALYCSYVLFQHPPQDAGRAVDLGLILHPRSS